MPLVEEANVIGCRGQCLCSIVTGELVAVGQTNVLWAGPR